MAARKFVTIQRIPPVKQNRSFCSDEAANATVLSNPTGEIGQSRAFYTCLAGKVRAQVIEHSLQNTAREQGHGRLPASPHDYALFLTGHGPRGAPRARGPRQFRNGPEHRGIAQARHGPAQALWRCRYRPTKRSRSRSKSDAQPGVRSKSPHRRHARRTRRRRLAPRPAAARCCDQDTDQCDEYHGQITGLREVGHRRRQHRHCFEQAPPTVRNMNAAGPS